MLEPNTKVLLVLTVLLEPPKIEEQAPQVLLLMPPTAEE